MANHSDRRLTFGWHSVVVHDGGSSLVADPTARPLGNVVGQGFSQADARDYRPRAQREELPKLLVRAEGRLASIYDRDGNKVRGPMPRATALNIVRVFG